MKQFYRIVVCLTLIGGASARPMHAQATDSLLPRAGAWAAEAPAFSTGGSLLRFTSPHSAWLLGVDVSTDHQGRSASGLDPGADDKRFYLRTQLGHRWYSNVVGTGDGHLRTTYGLGLTGSVNRYSTPNQYDHAWNAGGYGEFGATWFFTRHLSLGAMSLLQVTNGRDRQVATFFNPVNNTTARQTVTSSNWAVGASLVRVLAGVYF